MMSKGLVMTGDWKEQISVEYAKLDNFEAFLAKIWEMSLTAFDQPREVQVVIDADEKLFMTHGNPGLVWFDSPPAGMKLPVKCWIHTHPFGHAYFSSTDWATINTWKPIMNCAIVLGENQRMTWTQNSDFTHYERWDYNGIDEAQTTLDEYEGEE